MPETRPHEAPEGLRLPVLALEHPTKPRSESYPNPFSDSLSTLDFSHLLTKKVGYAPRPSSPRGPIDAPTPQRSSKLTLLRKGSSEASLGHALGHMPIGHSLLFVVDGRHSQDVGRLFTGCPRAPTRKKSKEYPWNPLAMLSARQPNG